MLQLQSDTSLAWVGTVEAGIDEVLIDHAHCEKKAAGTAMNLIFSYVESVDFVQPLCEIVTEELEHFSLVLDLIKSRGITFRKQQPSSYGRRLSELVRKEEPEKILDRCLIAALIEARSCERFGVLRDHLRDPELAQFYGSLYDSEMRHYGIYLRFAQGFAAQADRKEEVAPRLRTLARKEAEIIALGDPFPRIHS
ncbi:tRNA-hydroxylase [Planctomycetales bacterium 10988]|nr:tRNA-hydroxylase [Planctomycetales bacterium 10988]